MKNWKRLLLWLLLSTQVALDEYWRMNYCHFIVVDAETIWRKSRKIFHWEIKFIMWHLNKRFIFLYYIFSQKSSVDWVWFLTYRQFNCWTRNQIFLLFDHENELGLKCITFLYKCNWSYCNWIFNLISTTLNMNSSHAWDKKITWTCFETQNFTKLLCNLFSHNIVWACIMYVALCFVHLHSAHIKKLTNFCIYWI